MAFEDVDVFQQIGEDGFARLVRAFYAQVPGDDVLGPMYPPEDLAGDGALEVAPCPLNCATSAAGSGRSAAWISRSSAISAASRGSGAIATSFSPLSSNCHNL